MFNFSINKNSKRSITPVKAIFRMVEAYERLRCFGSGMDFGVDVRAALRGWLGVTPCSIWIEDDADEVCIIFSLKDEQSSKWEECSLYLNREGELSSPYLSDEMLSKLQQGLDQLFKD